jgi:glyoxylase-like metal-dependent hydrolase (beta-lactamase superfamily II)
MTVPICVQCGVQYDGPREGCPICADERQYVRWGGQAWTTLEEVQRDHHNRIEEEGPGLWGIGTEPAFAIGQRALLVRTPTANVLWDCITLIDDDTVARVEQLGGIDAVAISHPHYYGIMVEWSRAFGDAPIYVHAADRQWLGRRDNVVLWEGETCAIGDGLTLLACGVHFDGGTVLHWAGGEGGAGALLSGDIFQVVMDRRYVSFMYSYPNLIPERPDTVRRAVELTEPYPFTRIYGAWWGRIVGADGKDALRRSAERYLAYTGG